VRALNDARGIGEAAALMYALLITFITRGFNYPTHN
jgi:hypothetical protein